jgi:hypothetical protein
MHGVFLNVSDLVSHSLIHYKYQLHLLWLNLDYEPVTFMLAYILIAFVVS